MAPTRKSAAKAAPAKKAPARKGKKLAPISSLSPAYKARLKRQAAKEGITLAQLRRKPGGVQAARGHKEREHVTRKERQDDRISAFAERQARRGEAQGSRSADEIEEALREMIADKGMAWFRKLELAIERLYRAAKANHFKPLPGFDFEAFAEVYQLPKQELYYH